MTDSLFLAVLVLASGSLGLLVYGVTAMFAPEWAAHMAHLERV